jgi:carboxyl-terminal processing protease
VADSLISEYKTRNGRLVYDGSGIFPDIYMERKSYSNISVALGVNYFYHDYAGKYFRTHNSIAAARTFRLSDQEYNDFVTFVDDKKYEYTDKSERSLEELKKNAEKERALSPSAGI